MWIGPQWFVGVVLKCKQASCETQWVSMLCHGNRFSAFSDSLYVFSITFIALILSKSLEIGFARLVRHPGEDGK